MGIILQLSSSWLGGGWDRRPPSQTLLQSPKAPALTSFVVATYLINAAVELHLKKPSCQLGSDCLLEADHQHLLLPDDPCDVAKALEELPHNDRLLPADRQAWGLDEDLVVAGEGGQVVDVHKGVEETALHLHNTVVSLLWIFLVVEEDEASCLVGINEVDVKNPDVEAGEAWRDVLLGENPSFPALHSELQPGDEWGYFLMAMVNLYLSLGSKVCMDASSLFLKNSKSGDMSTRSVRSGRQISIDYFAK